jgi:hypothetical protein
MTQGRGKDRRILKPSLYAPFASKSLCEAFPSRLPITLFQFILTYQPLSSFLKRSIPLKPGKQLEKEPFELILLLPLYMTPVSLAVAICQVSIQFFPLSIHSVCWRVSY